MLQMVGKAKKPAEKTRTGNQCPRCGAVGVSVTKTWQLVAPLPDSQGRITVTVMASFECDSCGYKWRGVLTKMKVGGESVEIEGAKQERVEAPEAPRPSQVIELDLDEIMEE